MTQYQLAKYTLTGMLVFVLFSTLAVAADPIEIKGLIQGRSGATMIIKTSDSETITVMLTDTTEVGEVQGMLKVRRKEMSMAALIPGLAVQIEAMHGEHNQLIAKSVKFKGNDLKSAKAISAGMHETDARSKQNAAAIQKNADEIKKNQEDLAKQQAALRAQKQALQQQQEKVAENQKKIAQNKTAIDAAMARFGQLDDYYILDEQTVLFANGKIDVDAKYKAPLLQLAQKAKSFEGYMIEIKGYASSAGSESLNQKLSEDRADNVANIIIQQGHIPLTNLLSPAAMGESDQVGTDASAEGQAQNRRVVVRVLQNKAIAGIQ